MQNSIKRREFLRLTAAGSTLCFCSSGLFAAGMRPSLHKMISPGCRGTKVKVARVYLGSSHGLWPEPNMDFNDEIRHYESRFEELKNELSDVEFTVDRLITSPEEVGEIKEGLKEADGILAIHFNIGIRPALDEILALNQPTMVFAVPYSGHEWVGFGELQKQPLGAKMGCMLTSDYTQLATAIRPFRAIHHLREAKILNLTTHPFSEYAQNINEKFGTEIKRIELARVMDAYHSISEEKARAETDRWISGAMNVVEPLPEEIYNSCKLALALEKLVNEENAILFTADCYGSMHGPLCQSVAYPCIGFTRLNDMGLGGICESDLQSAMTHILFQGLSGKPGFISDPTVDESNNTIILAHCLGSTKMDGPEGPAAPYNLRTIMEREEGVVPQVKMRVGQKVTQAKLVETEIMPYFTGEIVDTPVALEDDRGCRTKITVRVDGNVTKLWKNWSYGLHRVTCYGNITRDLERFCRFKELKLVNEAV